MNATGWVIDLVIIDKIILIIDKLANTQKVVLLKY
jgi:hypothetical protein